jgi:hypothetical protein
MSQLIVETTTTELIEAGVQGPPGPPGTAYERRHEFVLADLTDYMAYADAGSDEGDDVWTVTRLTIAANGTQVSVQAVGVNWTDRATHTYS